MRIVLCFIVFINSMLITGTEREIAITLDDLPVVLQERYSEVEQKKIFNRVLNSLAKHEVKATGFVVGKKIRNEIHRKMLKSFIDRGHTIGNHSFSHYDLNNTDNGTYCEDIKKCRKVISEYLKGEEYFRYPMLHRGNSKEKREAIYSYLRKNGYKTAPVSIDNDEYSFNIPALRAFRNGKQDELEGIRQKYFKHMFSRFDYYEKLSEKKLGRPMKHILLLHLNLLNSLFLEELLAEMRKRGWKFITMEEALTDPVYREKDSYAGPKGIGWLERLN